MSSKRQLSVKPLNENFKLLRDIEKGLSRKNISLKYGAPPNTISMQDLINKLETLLTREKIEKCKQVCIMNYFVKEKKIFIAVLILLCFFCFSYSCFAYCF